MSWTNVRLIFLRELRDQLRDRRTLFTIAVLPLVLYPLMGMAMLQIAQFRREHPAKIWVIGSAGLPEDPVLIHENNFAPELMDEGAADSIKMRIDAKPTVPLKKLAAKAEKEIHDGNYDAVLYFPPDFAAELSRFQTELKSRTGSETGDDATEAADVDKLPAPLLYVNTASDKSRIAQARIEAVLSRWRESIVKQSLVRNRIPVAVTKPFVFKNNDVAHEVSRRAAFWSKILPFVVLVWALTGAFYPAIDLCAGEKERGTLETLLSSPAGRNEIVIGKLMTVMAFSVATSVLNMISMGFTGLFFMNQMQQFDAAGAFQIGPPPVAAMGWLLVCLPPVSALFSALSLAIAAFARSSKEGQYYLMPLLLITMPLMLLPMLPAASLDLGTSLIPVTGMMLLLRLLMEGQFSEALPFVPTVFGVTIVCSLLAVRWAIAQFQNESVIFSASERWGLGLWLRHLVRDRGDTPTFGEAIMCGVLLLMIRFFGSLVTPMPDSWNGFAISTVITLVALLATPALLMAIMLTRKPRKTLMLNAPRPLVLPAVAVLAVCIHPAAMLLTTLVHRLYPLSNDVAAQLGQIQGIFEEAPSIWMVLLVLAVTPAICEEIAFRGFILSGLRHMGHKWAAIIISSIFFGAAHGVLQQSITACLVGVVIAFLAIHSGSLFTGMLFHLIYNSMSLVLSLKGPELLEQYPVLQWVLRQEGAGCMYQWYVIVLGAFAAVGILLWFRKLPFERTAEEELRHALDHPNNNAVAMK